MAAKHFAPYSSGGDWQGWAGPVVRPAQHMGTGWQRTPQTMRARKPEQNVKMKGVIRWWDMISK